jgi:NAD(P)H-dependent FMN reductase
VRILALCGSLQARSGNLTLLETAARRAPAGVTVTLFDGLRHLPPFDPDLEAHGEHTAVAAFRRALSSSDAVLIASPEYGHSLPGSLKNAIDWVIGTAELERKIVAITCAVPHQERGRMGLAALRGTLGAVSATLTFDEPIVKGPDFEPAIDAVLLTLVEAIEARRRAS